MFEGGLFSLEKVGRVAADDHLVQRLNKFYFLGRLLVLGELMLKLVFLGLVVEDLLFQGEDLAAKVHVLLREFAVEEGLLVQLGFGDAKFLVGLVEHLFDFDFPEFLVVQ